MHPIAKSDDLIAGGRTSSLEVAIQQHIGIKKELHGSMDMLGGQLCQPCVSPHLVRRQQLALARPFSHKSLRSTRRHAGLILHRNGHMELSSSDHAVYDLPIRNLNVRMAIQ